MKKVDLGYCPRFHYAVELIGRRWSGAIILVMLGGASRYSEIRDAIPGLSDRLLSERLRELETEGIIDRTVLPGNPARRAVPSDRQGARPGAHPPGRVHLGRSLGGAARRPRQPAIGARQELRGTLMEYRDLGRTGLRVSAIGFGSGSIGGLMVRGEHAEQRAAVALAIDGGINYFDTAAQYGEGRSEEHLGRALREVGTQAYVGTKVRLLPEQIPTPPERYAARWKMASAAWGATASTSASFTTPLPWHPTPPAAPWGSTTSAGGSRRACARCATRASRGSSASPAWATPPR